MQIHKIFKALSDPNRLRIMKMLEKKELCVCEITAVLGLAASTVSKHLSILRENALILDNKDGKWVNYRINYTMDNAVLRHLLPLLRGWENDSEEIIGDREALVNTCRDDLCGLK